MRSQPGCAYAAAAVNVKNARAAGWLTQGKVAERTARLRTTPAVRPLRNCRRTRFAAVANARQMHRQNVQPDTPVRQQAFLHQPTSRIEYFFIIQPLH